MTHQNLGQTDLIEVLILAEIIPNAIIKHSPSAIVKFRYDLNCCIVQPILYKCVDIAN